MNIYINNSVRIHPVFTPQNPCCKLDNKLRLLPKTMTADTVSFGSKMPLNSLNDFNLKLKSKYGECSIEDVIIKNCNTGNFLGAGSEGKVFLIKPFDNYVVKVNHPVETSLMNLPDNELVSVEDKFLNHNFGQPVATNKNGISIIKKVNGTPNTIKNYRNCVRNGELII